MEIESNSKKQRDMWLSKMKDLANRKRNIL